MLRSNQLIGFGAGGSGIVPITYDGTNIWNSSGTTQNFGNFTVGDPGPYRHIMAVVAFRVTTTAVVNSMGINGVALTRISSNYSNTGTNDELLAIFHGIIDASTTLNVQTTTSVTATDGICSLWHVYRGDTNITEETSQSNQVLGAGDIDLAVPNSFEYGVAGVCCAASDLPHVHSWTSPAVEVDDSTQDNIQLTSATVGAMTGSPVAVLTCTVADDGRASYAGWNY